MEFNITKEVATMQRQSVNDLRDRYQAVFGEDTRARNKQWLIKRIAWKRQANEEGDISERARRLAIARIVTGQKNINGFQFFKLGKSETTVRNQPPVHEYSIAPSTPASPQKKG